MSKKIILTTTLAAALAATASGCSRQSGYGDDGYYAANNTAVCTDRSGRRVPDRYCQRGGHGMGNAFLWYYLGRSSAVPYYGSHVTGGSFTRTAGATYFHAPAAANVTRSVAVSRGGLGSSARGFGGSFGGGRGSFGSVGG